MNSIELAYQLRRLTIDSNNSSSSVPPPPDTISASMASCDSADTAQIFELESSHFNSFSPPSSAPQYQYESSFNDFMSFSSAQESTERGLSLSNLRGGLSRSRCANNLSALCSITSSVGSTRSTYQVSYESGDKACWGYYVDTPSR